jgi:hypothetical protein
MLEFEEFDDFSFWRLEHVDYSEVEQSPRVKAANSIASLVGLFEG